MVARSGQRQPPTESDVAELAGVSQSAVSRAFTPGGSVGEETRRKVFRAARQLGYHPNLIARSLSTKRSNIVGLAISSLENPFYAQVVKELSERLSATGRHILLFATSPGEAADPEIETFLSYQIDALILTATSPSKELVRHCRKSGVPVVLINRDTSLPGVSTVRGENRRAGEIVAAFLIAGGHKRFAFIAGTEVSSVSHDREAAFSALIAAEEKGPVVIRFGNYTFEGGAAAARALLSMPQPPDAIFCASDYMAFAAIDVARREFGRVLQRDLSIVGFDDVAEASQAAYDLTTFSQPPAALAHHAIAIIDNQFAKRGTRAERREIRGDLVVRGTAREPDEGVVKIGKNKIWTPK